MKHRYEYQIIFGDTDQMGVVYYANYLRFFEGARASYWRALGRSYKDLEDVWKDRPHAKIAGQDPGQSSGKH